MKHLEIKKHLVAFLNLCIFKSSVKIRSVKNRSSHNTTLSSITSQCQSMNMSVPGNLVYANHQIDFIWFLIVLVNPCSFECAKKLSQIFERISIKNILALLS